MHLLAAAPGQIEDGAEPIDLGQTPGDVVFISAADTELALLSEAHQALKGAHSLRLSNLTHLVHPMSVDLHIDRCALGARLVIARVLGGAGYWRYGLEQYSARLREKNIPFVALPGDAKPDHELLQFSNISEGDYLALWSYLNEGGAANAQNFLRYASAMLDEGARPPAAKPLLKAGLYWPGSDAPSLQEIKRNWDENAAIVPILFYRALIAGAGLHPINRLVKALLKRGLAPLPIFVTSLKDPVSIATLHKIFEDAPPKVVLNATSFATSTPDSPESNPLIAECVKGAPVFQLVLSSGNEELWERGKNGLSARDIAMNVALPEIDGRVLTRAISFKDEAYFDDATQASIATYRARGDRVNFVADLTKNWAELRDVSASEKRVALILANYPNKDGRLANGVGLDSPQSSVDVLWALKNWGYHVENAPETSDELMDRILRGPTNQLENRRLRKGDVRLELSQYLHFYDDLPFETREEIEKRWGAAENDPFVQKDAFALSILEFGNIVLGVQPARGYNIDPKETYHAPDLCPPHHYLAFYFWLRHVFKSHVTLHMGKHGNLEWLPGKSMALSQSCFPEIVFGPTPHLYPFIVNDPGEGTAAKRRAQAVILDHLTPPMTRAETYGPLLKLEALLDEYFEASGLDPRRMEYLKGEILSLSAASGLDRDIGLNGDDMSSDFSKLDEYLCELKEAQIRDGLHIFGTSPIGVQRRDLAIATLRVPKMPKGGAAPGMDARPQSSSLLRQIADALELDFDPLDCKLSAKWQGPRPEVLAEISPDLWRNHGDTIERLELLAQALFDGKINASAIGLPDFDTQKNQIFDLIDQCGPKELSALRDGLEGRAVMAGPSGAPTRGRMDVLPTGRNFFSLDSRSIPTQAAWSLGWKSADLLIERHLQDQGDWPRALLVTAWGTSNMRTGGDDIAQALALMGVRPKWDEQSRRVTGFEVLPLSVLGRPRVDVTLRISGFFRDAFPAQIELFDTAARAIQALDEPADQNAAAHSKDDPARIFGAKPGAYGAGLQALIDERIWNEKADLGEAYLVWGGYSYGKSGFGKPARGALENRLKAVEGIVQNQDNREHDLLDSDDYYQFEGGASAAVETLQNLARPIYHNDHSRPEKPIIRTLDEEIARVVHSRVANPKWIDGVKRHGYKGAFEMAATIDYLFAFSVTTDAVKSHHFDRSFDAFIRDDATLHFIREKNPNALEEMLTRFSEALDLGVWQPRRNSDREQLERLRQRAREEKIPPK